MTLCRSTRDARAGAVLIGLLLLSGCQLPDQRSFGAAAYVPPPAPKAAAARHPQSPWTDAEPLAVIRFANQSSDYVGPLRTAVKAAEARKPNVVFTVVGVAPGGGAIAMQARAATSAAEAARAVMQAIERMGVPSARILLASRTDPTVSAQEVLVFVR